MKLHTLGKRLTAMLTTGLLWGFAAFGATAVADDAQRRKTLQAYAAMMFSETQDHCEAFAMVAEKAASLAPSAGAWLEDMRLVVIGEDWNRKKRGKWFSGVKTSDGGFKPSLKDGSSQVEHAMAAIYLGKGLPPVLTTVGGSLKEVKDAFTRGMPVSQADVLLWAIGEDIGARLSNSNMKQVGTPIRNTMCD